MKIGFADRGGMLIRSLVVGAFALIAAGTQAQTLPEVQIYENTTVFPGESRYFMTARETDKAFLAANPQMGWRKIDTFSAYPGTDAPAGVSSVCRFFLPTLATHFYTADATECDRFKRDPLFQFEGLDFGAIKAVNGTCGAGNKAVYRAFNNGLSRGVSGNHYFGTDAGLGNYLARFSGWSQEGIAMCVPDVTKASAKVVLAGRAEVVRSELVPAEAAALPVAVVVDTETLTTKTFVDPLGGESDWQTRSAFDAFRGKLYLIRANTVLTRTEMSNGVSQGAPGPAGPPSSPLFRVEPTRGSNNVMELDVQTGQARYLAVPGAFTDIHFNAEQRLLVLAGPDATGKARMLWFDPSRNVTVSETQIGSDTLDVSIRHIGQPACEYFTKSSTLTQYYWWPMYMAIEVPSTGCVDAAGILRGKDRISAHGTLDRLGQGIGCILGDSLFVPGAGTVRQHRLGDMEIVGDLPRADFGTPDVNYFFNYAPNSCFVQGGDLFVNLHAAYAPKTTGYFVVQYRNGQVLNKIGPLTEPVHLFPNTPLENWAGPPPVQLEGTDVLPIQRPNVSAKELWVLSPRSAEGGQVPTRSGLQRLDPANFQKIQEVSADLPARRIHAATR